MNSVSLRARLKQSVDTARHARASIVRSRRVHRRRSRGTGGSGWRRSRYHHGRSAAEPPPGGSGRPAATGSGVDLSSIIALRSGGLGKDLLPREDRAPRRGSQAAVHHLRRHPEPADVLRLRRPPSDYLTKSCYLTKSWASPSTGSTTSGSKQHGDVGESPMCSSATTTWTASCAG